MKTTEYVIEIKRFTDKRWHEFERMKTKPSKSAFERFKRIHFLSKARLVCVTTTREVVKESRR